MLLDNKPYTFDRVARLAIAVGLFWVAIRVLDYLSDVLLPFVTAFALAYLMSPLVDRVQRVVKSRVAAVVASLLLAALLAFFCVAVLTPVVTKEIAQASATLSQLLDGDAIQQTARENLPPEVYKIFRNLVSVKKLRQMLAQDTMQQTVLQAVQKALPGVLGVLTGTASVLLGFLGLSVVALYTVFLLVDWGKLAGHWKEWLPIAYRETASEFAHDFGGGMEQYFRAQALIAAIVGALFALGFWLIGLPLGILFGLLVGVMNMIPYLQLVSIPAAFVLAVLQAAQTGQGFFLVLGLVTLVYVVVQTIQDVVLVPKIMGGSTGLSPVLMLLSLSIWGKLLGLFGLLIAIPATCLALVYYRRWLSRRPIAEL